MSRPRLLALLLALVTLAVYLPVRHDAFLCFDDGDYVTGNSMVQNGLTWAGVKWAFTTFHAANWHPLTWLSHMTDCQLFLLNPGAHHFVNVLFHAANTALLFILLWRLTGRLLPPAFVAALFALHPLHVESVAWIAERKDVLSTFFALLTLLSYARHVQTLAGKGALADGKATNPAPGSWRAARHYWLAVFFFALGLLAKPMLVTLPFVLVLLDFWPLNRVSQLKPQIFGLLVEKWPFFLLTLGSCVATFVAQGASHAVLPVDILPLHYRIENAAVAYAAYLFKIFWPVNLAVIYPFCLNSIATIAAATTVLLLLSAAVWRARHRRPCLLVGWLWFLGTLVPVIGLVQVGGTAMADRYTYIPSIGIFIAIAFGVPERFWAKTGFRLGAAVLLVVCAGLTEKQLRYWRDSETLFRHTLAITRNNLMAHVCLAVALEQQGRNAEALTEYCAVAGLDPSYPRIYFFIGNMLEKSGRPTEALAAYRRCLQQSPQNSVLHCAAGNALATMAKFNAALQEFDQAEQLDSKAAQPHLGKANVFFAQGLDHKAVGELWTAARLEPYDFEVLANVAHHLAANENPAARDGPNALVLALKADELSHSSEPGVEDVLGMAFAETGDFSNAVTSAQTALNLAETRKLANVELFRQRLASYQEQRPWHESFATTNVSGE